MWFSIKRFRAFGLQGFRLYADAGLGDLAGVIQSTTSLILALRALKGSKGPKKLGIGLRVPEAFASKTEGALPYS